MIMRQSFASVIAASALVAACHGHDEGSGATVSRNYQVGNFHEIEVAGPFDVDVRTGSGPSVSARGSDKLLERTLIEVEGDKLVVRPKSNRSFFHFGNNDGGKASLTITVPQLSALTLAGTGDVHIDRVQGSDFDGTIAGHGDMTLGQVAVQQIKLTIAGSGNLKANAGTTKSAEYAIAGHGDLDAGGVQAQDLKVDIAGSGSIHAHASGAADIDIVGSGDVDVAGGAKCNVSKLGSGDVHCT